jgi:hypothetical protein
VDVAEKREGSEPPADLPTKDANPRILMGSTDVSVEDEEPSALAAEDYNRLSDPGNIAADDSFEVHILDVTPEAVEDEELKNEPETEVEDAMEVDDHVVDTPQEENRPLSPDVAPSRRESLSFSDLLEYQYRFLRSRQKKSIFS